jgi:hypothetical protein
MSAADRSANWLRSQLVPDARNRSDVEVPMTRLEDKAMRKLLFGVGVLALCAFMAQPADAFLGRGGHGGSRCCSGWNDCDSGGGGRLAGHRDRGCCYSTRDSGCSTCGSDVVVDGSHSHADAVPAPEAPNSQTYDTRRPTMPEEHAGRDLDQHRRMPHPQSQSPNLRGQPSNEQPSRNLSGEPSDQQGNHNSEQGNQGHQQDRQSNQHGKQGDQQGDQSSPDLSPPDKP